MHKKSSLKPLTACLLSAMIILSACGAPKRGESELEYKNRLAKYTIAGAFIGGYFGAYHAKANYFLPIGKIVRIGNPERMRFFLTVFYTALGATAGHSFVKYEGELKRLLADVQTHTSGAAFKALESPEMEKEYGWNIPTENASGAFKVVDRYTGSKGFACQDLIATVNADDETATVQQTACQTPNGHWEIWARG